MRRLIVPVSGGISRPGGGIARAGYSSRDKWRLRPAWNYHGTTRGNTYWTWGASAPAGF
ncbi:MAG: hypothetical protein ACFFD2_03290 [Promethearchaeota archaeon]